MRYSLLLVVFLLVFLIASCAPAPSQPVQQPDVSLPETDGAPQVEETPEITAVAGQETPSRFQEMLRLVNQARSQARACGANSYEATGPLSFNTLLAVSADAHAEDMNEKRFFGHTGSDGSDVSLRVTRTGYPWARVGENLAYGTPERYEAKEIVDGWLASPGHCKNIMNPEFKEVGFSKLTDTYDYWVHVFGVAN